MHGTRLVRNHIVDERLVDASVVGQRQAASEEAFTLHKVAYHGVRPAQQARHREDHPPASAGGGMVAL